MLALYDDCEVHHKSLHNFKCSDNKIIELVYGACKNIGWNIITGFLDTASTYTKYNEFHFLN
jgi:hypothetical protein